MKKLVEPVPASGNIHEIEIEEESPILDGDDINVALNIEETPAAGDDQYVRIEESDGPKSAEKETWLGGGDRVRNGPNGDKSAPQKRAFSLMFWKRKGAVGTDLPTRVNIPTSPPRMYFSVAEVLQLMEKHWNLVFGTLAMAMVTLLSALDDPFSIKPDKVDISLGNALILLLPSIAWMESYLVCSFISICGVLVMPPRSGLGFRKYLMVPLTFVLAYGIISWFAKAHGFRVLVGSTKMNGAFFCGVYLTAVSITAWPIIFYILYKRAKG